MTECDMQYNLTAMHLRHPHDHHQVRLIGGCMQVHCKCNHITMHNQIIYHPPTKIHSHYPFYCHYLNLTGLTCNNIKLT